MAICTLTACDRHGKTARRRPSQGQSGLFGVGAALGAIAGFVLACFGIKKEFDANDKKLEKLDKIPDEKPEEK